MKTPQRQTAPRGRTGRRAADLRAGDALGGLVLGLALSGCASMAPVYERPAAPVAARWTVPSAAEPGSAAEGQGALGSSGAAGVPAAAADIAWTQFFGDPRLRRLIELALSGNRDLRVAALNIEQTRAQFQLRRADEVPAVGAGLAGARQPTGGGSPLTLYSAGLTLTSYELDLFGRIRSLRDVALAQYLASEEARKATQISLVAAVASVHLSLQADDELLAVTRRTLASREESWKLFKLRYEHGAVSELDLRQSESLLEAARVALAQQTRQRLLDENALVLLIGQPLPTGLPEGLSIGDAQALAELPAGLSSEVLLRRPDVQAAEQQLIAANANIGAARAAFFPKITLTASVGVASKELSGLFGGGSFAWGFTPQLLLPIFDGGRNQANLELARAGRDLALAQYEKAIQSAFREVADGLAGRATLTDQQRAQRGQVEAESARLRLAELRYRGGASSFLEVIDARRSLFAAQQALVLVQLQQLQNGVALYKALGGGWGGPPAVP